MVPCRSDISFPLIKLSQYSAKLALLHFHAPQGIFDYIRATKSDDMYYWREQACQDLLPGIKLIPKDNNNYEPQTRHQPDHLEARAVVDLYYTNDSTYRRSATGIAIKIAGGAVF